ncbi:MAG: sulfatase-like hydrolase/transferase, partial [Thermomicrobiales bacterium]
PRTPAINEADVSDKPKWVQKLKRLGQPAQRQSDLRYRDQYRTMLAVHEMVRDLIATLEHTGQLDNTWLFFTSDNGQFYGEHRLPNGKGSLYEEGIRVPLVVRGPGVRRGATDLLVCAADLLPTILDLARSAYGNIDGRSFASSLTGTVPRAWRGACFVRYGVGNLRPAPAAAAATASAPAPAIERSDEDETVRGGSVYGLRGHDWSYIHSLRTGEEEFYDLRDDPYQLANAWDTLPAAAKSRLQQGLRDLCACQSESCHRVDASIPASAADLRSLA